MAQQPEWRYCHKCHGMFFNGFPDKGVCPNGGSHDQVDSYNFILPYDLGVTPTSQLDWRYCHKCHGLFYNGFSDKGVCPSGGSHDQAGSFNFVLPCSLPQTPTAQGAWRYCGNCHGMFYDGFPEKGVCPHGGGHVAVGLIFALPHDLPPALDFEFNPIVFDGGVPVGGNSHLTIRQDGSYTFVGHLHDSGATEYNVGVVWVVKDSQNMAYSFPGATGHVAGTFESGSRNFDWSMEAHDDQLANNWANLAAGPIARSKAGANIDLVNLTNAAIGLAGTVLGVVALAATPAATHP